ncbi:calcyphosin-like protein isoform X1 [Pecten maximus]|uniref:calcyphosin-like protein isoform X1 n=1 Tax=Pecten maximus TaxID=6579 RepID=UPI001458269F|nr:calcyphosin-like protein isoform X1 [Pecten maximus]
MYNSWKRDLSDKGIELMSRVRDAVLSRGCGGIKHLSVIFRHMDIDFSQKLSMDEFKIGIQKFGLDDPLTDEEMQILFCSFDTDDNLMVDFKEFHDRLRPALSQGRYDVIMETFQSLDINNDDKLKCEDLKVRFSDNVKCHPKYLSGEWTEEETLRSFLDTIDDQNNPDGVVTREEFLDYYAGVSALYDDDAYFDLTMRASYGLPKKGSNNNRK